MTLTKLTSEYENRVRAEIANCNLYLNKEMAFSEDLRNHNRIEELQKHITKLDEMIKNGYDAPKF